LDQQIKKITFSLIVKARGFFNRSLAVIGKKELIDRMNKSGNKEYLRNLSVTKELL